jgi:hypothetical protein
MLAANREKSLESHPEECVADYILRKAVALRRGKTQ